MAEPRTPFVSRRLEQSVAESFMSEIDELMRKKAPYLETNNAIEFQHGQRWASPANNLGDKFGEIEQHIVESSLALEDVVKGDPKIIFRHINKVAQATVSSFDKMFFSKCNEVTAQTGNVVNAADYSSPLEAYAAVLEKMEMSVDENGDLNLPTFILAPDQHKALLKEMREALPEMRERIEKIKAKKLAEATQKEAERRNRFEKRNT